MRDVLGATSIVFALAVISCGDDPATTDSSSSASSEEEGSSSAVTGTGESAQELCWNTINAYRKRDGLPPLARWEDGETCADGEAASDAKSGKAHGSFPRCGEMGQNECPGHPGPPEKGIPSCLAQMWAEGPGGGHHDAMASKKYTKVACGVFVTAKGTIWSVQNFR